MKNIKILNVFITKISYAELLNYIECAVAENKKNIISYAAFHTIIHVNESNELTDKINSFNILHADGFAVYLASRLLYGKNGLEKRITGSDFYPILISSAIKNNWKIFLFGDTEETLAKAVEKNSSLKICGTQNGFNYRDEDLIKKINDSGCQILIVGLGCPKQEIWITENKDKLNANIIIAVGDGIKVFAGTKKRGGRVFQTLGLEWLIRLINNPVTMWKRYLIGIPLFLYRVIKIKYFKY